MSGSRNQSRNTQLYLKMIIFEGISPLPEANIITNKTAIEKQKQTTPKIGKGVKVKTKTRPSSHGEVIEAIGKHKWRVKFDDGTTEDRKSSQLTIYAEYYNVKPSTPKSALKSIQKAAIRTIGGRGRRRQKQNGNNTSEEIGQSSSNGSRNDDSSRQ